jgi:hypothetical protein
MRAGLRWTVVLLGAGLLVAAAPALAQDATATQPTTSAPPPSDAIGPKELQNFSLKGSISRPSEQSTIGPIATSPATSAPAQAAQTGATPRRRTPERQPVRDTAAARLSAPAPSLSAQPPALAPNIATPLQEGTAPVPAPALPQAPAAAPLPSAPARTLAPERQVSILPWLLAALALAAGTLFLLWRRRPRQAFAGGPEIDLFAPPQPAPKPPPTPALAPRASAPQPAPEVPKLAPVQKGIVATGLRPQLELSVHPISCRVDGEQVSLEFELELFNAGAAPARAVLSETALFNASAAQDRELSAFFANPVGAGERLDAIAPMKRVAFASRVAAPRSSIQEYELAGRKTIVPVLAFNTLYEWSGGRAQTSAAYVVGRETKSNKLGPLPVNGAAREFRGLAARVLPATLRS